MRQNRTAIFSGAIALASFFAVGTGVVAGAAPTYAAPTKVSTSAIMRTSEIQHVGTVATLHAATAAVSGKTETILANAKGLPLYYFPSDTAKKSNVSGALLQLWPALVSAHPVGAGIPGKLTALEAANGHQVTYNGHFLYTFVDDTPGHVNGQGVSGFMVATPNLKSVSGSTKTAAAATNSTNSAGYGVATSSGSYGYSY
jgi:predicted lipoprotein with Yx(FWY)xxD motif